MIEINVLFFSVLQDLTACSNIPFTIPHQTTVEEALELIYQQWETLRPWDASLLVAVNHCYAQRTEYLKHGDELAVMPPVQGG